MNIHPITTVFGLSTIETELRTIGTELLVRADKPVVWPLITLWHLKQLSVYVAPTDTGITHAPDSVLGMTHIDYNNISYTVFLGE